MENEGWIEWSGGECPVADDYFVDIRFRFGMVRHSVVAGDFVDADDSLNYWIHDGDTHDIIAYRIAEPLS